MINPLIVSHYFYGAGGSQNYVANGGFDTNSLWVFATSGWSISGGVAVFSSGINNRTMYQNVSDAAIPMVRNTQYNITFTIQNANTGQANDVRIITRHPGGTSTVLSLGSVLEGTYTETFTVPDTADYDGGAGIGFTVDGGGAPPSFELDNVSVTAV